MPSNRSDNKSERIYLRVDPQTKNKIDQVAAEEHLSASKYIRTLIKNDIALREERRKMSTSSKIIAMGYSVIEDRPYAQCGNVMINFLSVVSPAGKETPIAVNNQVYYLMGHAKVSTDEEADKLIDAGIGCKFSGLDLYIDHYNLSPEDELYLRYGYGYRTRDYLDGIKDSIGLLSLIDEADIQFDSVEEIKQYNIGYGDCASIGKLDDGRYIAQIERNYCLDGYAIRKMYFSHVPAVHDVEIAMAIIDALTLFMLNCSDMYVCMHCGNLIHWLDVPDDIIYKVSCLRGTLHC